MFFQVGLLSVALCNVLLSQFLSVFLFVFRESCGICNWSYVQYVGKLTRWRQSGALVQPSHPMSVNNDFADYVTAEITYAWWSPALCVVCLKSFTW